MSYEGYEEFLCAKGHYHNQDCYADDLTQCPRCGAPIAYWHAVDQTNGYEEDNPSTKPAPVEKIGTEDEWRTDHHGNRFAVAVPLYRPKSEWRDLSKSENT